jgi:hypothetical protein
VATNRLVGGSGHHAIGAAVVHTFALVGARSKVNVDGAARCKIARPALGEWKAMI